MTDLQLSLIAAGGAFLVGLFSYYKWREYRAKKSVQRAFSSEHDDVLMQPGAGDRAEPTLTADTPNRPSMQKQAPHHDGAGQANGRQGDINPDMHSDMHPSPAPATEKPAAAPLPIDGLIDCVILMNLETALRGDKILNAIQAFQQVGNKSVDYIGFGADGDDGHWELIAHARMYTALRVGVQLASRSTALNELEYSELVTKLRQIADELSGHPELPDMMEVIERARSLHQFVAEHDAQLGVNILSNGAPWAISTLLIALEKQGFDLREDGRFVMPDGDGEGGNLFSLSTNVASTAETTSRLTLLLDVPCVAPPRNGFGMMIGCAEALVTRLDGAIVDDSNATLTEQALLQISEQVHAFYEDMHASQIPAGSTRALRLFN
jgi:hypothetical protein